MFCTRLHMPSVVSAAPNPDRGEREGGADIKRTRILIQIVINVRSEEHRPPRSNKSDMDGLIRAKKIATNPLGAELRLRHRY